MSSASRVKVFLCSFYLAMARMTAEVNITIITYGVDRYTRDVEHPFQSAFDVIFDEIGDLYPQLLENSSVSHVSLFYNNSNRATEIENIFKFYYDNQELFTSNYSGKFTALVVDSKENGALGVIKSFVREVPVFVAAIDPQEKFITQTMYPTYLNLLPSRDSDFLAALKLLAIEFKWTKMTVVCDCDPSDLECSVIYGFHANLCSTIGALTENGPTEEQYDIALHRVSLRSDRFLVRDFDSPLDLAVDFQSRVILLLLPPETVLWTMIKAFQKNMTKGGDYVFISIQLPPIEPSEMFYNWKPTNFTSEAFMAFKSLLVITKRSADHHEMKNFTDKVASKSAETNRTSPSSNFLTRFTTLQFLDIVPLILQALNNLSSELPSLEPITFVQRMRNKSYDSLSGPVHIDAYGSVISPVSVLRFDPNSATMKVEVEIDLQTRKIVGKTRDSLQWYGLNKLPPDIPICGLRNEKCVWLRFQDVLTGGILSLFGVLLITTLILMWRVRRRNIRRKYKDIFPDYWTKITLTDNRSIDDREGTLGFRAVIEGSNIYAKKVSTNLDLRHARRNTQLCSTLLLVRDLKHPNLAIFYGLTFQNKSCFLCGEFAERGSLNCDAIKRMRSTILADVKFRLSFIADIVKAVLYIHMSPLKFHGDLSSTICLVSNRFSVKIAHTGYRQLSSLLNTSASKIKLKRLKSSFERFQQCHDLRSAGLICLELLTTPDGYESATMDMNKNFLFTYLHNELQKVIKTSSNACSVKRELTTNLRKVIRKNLGDDFSIASHLMKQLEQLADGLETTVSERNAALAAEIEKVDMLLQQILPASVIVQLRKHETVAAELFESATVLFSDIPIFSEFASNNAPWIVVQFLNTIYSVFDQTLTMYDVYKVETINDSYVVTSGIPVRNGNKHAAEICELSLALRDAGKNLQITITGQLTVRVRMGINSGAVAAGVVGTRMPRYCLFGDAMNTASRMESHGKEDHIHVAGSTKDLASSLENHEFEFESRGIMPIKGKGAIETYWLLGNFLRLNDTGFLLNNC